MKMVLLEIYRVWLLMEIYRVWLLVESYLVWHLVESLKEYYHDLRQSSVVQVAIDIESPDSGKQEAQQAFVIQPLDLARNSGSVKVPIKVETDTGCTSRAGRSPRTTADL